MKKITKLLKLMIPMMAVGAITAPILLTSLTGCSSSIGSFEVHTALNIGNFLGKNAQYQTMFQGSSINYSNDDLLLTHSPNGGNYMICVGSNMLDDTNLFFSGNKFNRTQKVWEQNWLVEDNQTFASNLKRDNDTEEKVEEIQKLKFNTPIFFLIDWLDPLAYQDMRLKSNDPKSLFTIISPFQKWTKELIDNEKDNKIYWNSSKAPKDSDYIRMDDSAKAYRNFYSNFKDLYPSKQALVSENTSYMLFFERGYLAEVKTMTANPQIINSLTSYYQNDPVPTDKFNNLKK